MSICDPLMKLTMFQADAPNDHEMLRKAKLLAYSSQEAKDNAHLEFKIESGTLFVMHPGGVTRGSWNRLANSLLSQLIQANVDSPITFCVDEATRANYIEVFTSGMAK